MQYQRAKHETIEIERSSLYFNRNVQLRSSCYQLTTVCTQRCEERPHNSGLSSHRLRMCMDDGYDIPCKLYCISLV